MKDYIELKEIVTIANKQINNVVFGEVYKAILNVGVYVDENKLKGWLKMCAEIETLSTEEKRVISKELEYKRLKRQNEYLRHKLKELKETDESDCVVFNSKWIKRNKAMKDISFANLENCTAQANSLIGNLVTCFLNFAHGLDANDEAAEIIMELLDEHEIPYEIREVER